MPTGCLRCNIALEWIGRARVYYCGDASCRIVLARWQRGRTNGPNKTRINTTGKRAPSFVCVCVCVLEHFPCMHARLHGVQTSLRSTSGRLSCSTSPPLEPCCCIHRMSPRWPCDFCVCHPDLPVPQLSGSVP